MASANGVTDENLAWEPAWKIRQLFIERKLSPVEFAEMLLRRVSNYSHYGAFISVFPEQLLAQAKASTQRYT
jgi:Asp-tRNA(Asn)/Glu-tRNA(Gln) amidotransferase A subunit family amidase